MGTTDRNFCGNAVQIQSCDMLSIREYRRVIPRPHQPLAVAKIALFKTFFELCKKRFLRITVSGRGRICIHHQQVICNCSQMGMRVDKPRHQCLSAQISHLGISILQCKYFFIGAYLYNSAFLHKDCFRRLLVVVHRYDLCVMKYCFPHNISLPP